MNLQTLSAKFSISMLPSGSRNDAVAMFDSITRKHSVENSN